MKEGTLAYYVDRHIKENGIIDSPLKGVSFMRSDKHIPRAFFSYNPCIRILAQGRKRGYFAGQEIQYNEGEYLTISLPVSIEHETFGTKEKPVLGIIIDIDLDMLNELIGKAKKDMIESDMAIKNPSNTSCAPARNLQPIALDKCMHCAVLRLLHSFESKEKTRVMGNHFIKEILYNALCGKDGAKLHDLVKYSQQAASIAKALNYVHEHINHRFSIEGLAHKANMSVSVFHRSFKEIMGDSPLNHIKKIRLTKARAMVKQEDLAINVVAKSIGYENPSQFSREYKQLFGISPKGER
ncbi:MAG: AraC family transcriptional regulator [Rickettsiales bacterium]|nr:MAG: AraC family transcriptional regulator [Rickettsiales bacterium]